MRLRKVRARVVYKATKVSAPRRIFSSSFERVWEGRVEGARYLGIHAIEKTG